MIKIFLRAFWVSLMLSITMPFSLVAYAVKEKSPLLALFAITCSFYGIAACAILWFTNGWKAAALTYAMISIIAIATSIASKEKLTDYSLKIAESFVKKFS